MRRRNEPGGSERSSFGVDRRRRTGIWRRYFVVTASIVLVTTLILGLSIMVFVSNSWETGQKEQMSDNCGRVTELMLELYDAGGVILPDGESSAPTDAQLRLKTKLADLSASPGTAVFVTDASGKAVICPDGGSDGALCCAVHAGYRLSDEAMRVIRGSAPGTVSGTGDFYSSFTDSYFTSAYPVYAGDETLGIVVSVRDVSEGLRPYLENFLKMLLWAVGIALAASWGLTYLLAINMAKPLRQMVVSANKFSKGDFDERISIDSNVKEIHALSAAFNSMADNLALIEKSRSSFVSNVSHELKTPMTTIGGFIDGMLDGVIPPERYEHYLRIVSDEIKRLSSLVIAMLNLSRIEAGQMQLAVSRFDVSAHLIKTLIGFEQLINEKHINVTGLDSMPRMIIKADESLINQVFYNLIDNAIKFTDEGGSISFKGEFEPGDIATISIRNTGSGIPQEELDVIFDRFYKVDKSRSRDSKSFGLGLYIVKTIVDFHGGRIDAVSEEGKYTQFTIRLPSDTDDGRSGNTDRRKA